MGKRKTSKKALLEVALRLFSRKSYSKVSLEDIASEAGVSKGAIFHYFKTKLELAEEALDLLLTRFILTPFNRILRSKKEISEKLSDLVALSLKLTSNYGSKRLSFLMETFRELEKAGRGGFVKTVYLSTLESLTKALSDEGIPKPRERAIIFLAILDGLGVQLSILPDEFSEETFEKIKSEVSEVILCERTSG